MNDPVTMQTMKKKGEYDDPQSLIPWIKAYSGVNPNFTMSSSDVHSPVPEWVHTSFIIEYLHVGRGRKGTIRRGARKHRLLFHSPVAAHHSHKGLKGGLEVAEVIVFIHAGAVPHVSEHIHRCSKFRRECGKNKGERWKRQSERARQ